MMKNQYFTTLKLSLTGMVILVGLSGCQLIKLQPDRLSSSLASKTNHILTNHKLSLASQDLLKLVDETDTSCLNNLENCVTKMRSNETLDTEQVFSATSELYLARAFQADQKSECKKDLKQQLLTTTAHSNQCLEQQLSDFDHSLRYSYIYLFKTEQAPESRLFDLRQGQVRTFYNVALSRLITTSYTRFAFNQFPEKLNFGQIQYQFDFKHYPNLKHASIDKLQSSYNLHFSGLDTINRQEGLGSEFVLVKKRDEQTANEPFILDPENYYKNQKYEKKYLLL